MLERYVSFQTRVTAAYRKLAAVGGWAVVKVLGTVEEVQNGALARVPTEIASRET